jgi:hypothetical protein
MAFLAPPAAAAAPPAASAEVAAGRNVRLVIDQHINRMAKAPGMQERTS